MLGERIMVSAVRAVTVERTESDMQAGLRRRQWAQKGAFGLLWAAGVAVIAVLFFVIAYLLFQGGKFFTGAEDLSEAAVVLESDAEIHDAVRADPHALGFVSLSYLARIPNAEGLKLVLINGVLPSVENVQGGWYPIVQNLTVVTHGEVSAIAQAWIRFAMSREGQAAVAAQGFVPLDPDQLQPYTAAGDTLSGELTVGGPGSMAPLAEALAAKFNELYPDVVITIQSETSTDGIKDAGKDAIDVGMSSREVREYEVMRYGGLEVYIVARDGLAIVANPQMTVGALTINQARDLFTGAITNWTAVGGPDADVTVVSRSMTGDSWDAFEKWILSKGALMAEGLASGHLRLFFQGVGASVKSIFRFLTTKPLPGMGGRGGISTTIVTTVYLVVLTLAIATPLGVFAAIYLVEYAGEMSGQSAWMRRVVTMIRFAVETLAGVPSIIYGLFGFALFVTVMKLGLSMLSGALAGACLILPTIIRTTEESLLTVPRSYREGSLALGATKWQTNYQVVLPAAMPGIVTGIILGAGRVVSETAVFYVTLGGSINFPESVMDQGRTMVLHLYSLMMDANAPDPAMGTAVVLIVVVVTINLAINRLSHRLSQRMAGKA